jgi:hypothetical protein
MIKSENGVMSTSDDSVLHLGWTDSFGNVHNCTTPLHLHRDVDGTLLSCEQAEKVQRMGGITIKRIGPSEKQAFSGPINLPR